MADATRSGWSCYLGWYTSSLGSTVEIKAVDGQLLGAVAGVPAGAEIVLMAEGEHTFRMQNGPSMGAVVTFRMRASSEAEALMVGEVEFSRVSADAVVPPAPHACLRAPAMELEGSKGQAFATLLKAILQRRDGDWIDYTLSFSKHEFLRYVSDQQVVLFHGSNNPDIRELKPIRKSHEPRDDSGRGNLQAVYATADGLLSAFFAIVDRDKITGSIRSGLSYYNNKAGERMAIYHLSINRESFDKRPWCTGTLYLLPRDAFFQLMSAGHAPSSEWASLVDVKPIARLSMEPEEFPFLHQIGTHEDSSQHRYVQLKGIILSAVIGAEAVADSLELILKWDNALQDSVAEFLALQRTHFRSMSCELHIGERRDVAHLTLQGPPAVLQAWQDALQEIQ